jgi:ATP-binding cassette subfamily C protein CydC
MKTIIRLLSFLMPFIGLVVLSIFLGSITFATAGGLFSTSAYLISRAALHPSIASLQIAIVGVRFFGISRGIFRYLERLVSHDTNFQILARLRVWFYQKIEPLSPISLTYFFSGDLLARCVSDIETLENFYLRVVAPPVEAGIIIAFTTWLVAQWHPNLALVICGSMLVTASVLPWLTHFLNCQTNKQSISDRSALTASLVEGIQGIVDLLAYQQENAYTQKTNAIIDRCMLSRWKVAFASGISSSISFLSSYLTLLIVLITAIPLILDGTLEGFLLAVLTLLTFASFEALIPLQSSGQHLESSLQAGRRVFEITDLPGSSKESTSPAPEPISTHIAFHELTYHYSPELPPALWNISFDLPAGKKVAIVGANGSGKSTVAALLLRFLDAQREEITIDSIPIGQYTSRQIHQLIGAVLPPVRFFNTTLRQNLLLAHPSTPDQDLISIIHQVEMGSWFSSLANGLDTWLGEQGILLSAGEYQRLAIARLLLQNARIWILDEPTANLDTKTEQEIFSLLHSLSNSKSVVWITQRLVMMEKMDEILVLKAGKIVERGTHTILLQHDALYSRYWQMQNRNLPDPGTYTPLEAS